jgi:hypothetical protein
MRAARALSTWWKKRIGVQERIAAHMEPMDIRLGDVYTLRKPHPCGGYDWRVVRVGADIGMRCVKCDHKVLLARSEFERRVKKLVERETVKGET